MLWHLFLNLCLEKHWTLGVIHNIHFILLSTIMSSAATTTTSRTILAKTMVATMIAVLLLLSPVVTAFAPPHNAITSPLSPRTMMATNNALPSCIVLSSAATPIELQETKYLEIASSAKDAAAEIIYIIMYLPGTSEEGVHTTEFPKDSGTEVMLAFESLDEVNNFSNMLRTEPSWKMEPVPTPTPLAQMEAACQQMGLELKVVPE